VPKVGNVSTSISGRVSDLVELGLMMGMWFLCFDLVSTLMVEKFKVSFLVFQ